MQDTHPHLTFFFLSSQTKHSVHWHIVFQKDVDYNPPQINAS